MTRHGHTKHEALSAIASDLVRCRVLAEQTGSDFLPYLIDMARDEVSLLRYEAANCDQPLDKCANGKR